MKSIYDIVDAALAEAVADYYHGMPEFEEGEEPDTFATYTVQETPEDFASGVSEATRYIVYIDLFTPGIDETLKNGVVSSMLASGGCYLGGRDDGNSSSFPTQKRKSLEFLFVI